ncbi:MAG: hypothetical protein EBR82_33245 [Caulobacteraceae bacterium]|nr:hypothetical protein [Caulobacteraceae bacterium]
METTIEQSKPARRTRKPNRNSVPQKVKRMILAGHDNRFIINKLHCKPHVVYNVRYQINKQQGIGGLVSTNPIIESPKANDVPLTPPVDYPIPVPQEEEKPTLFERIRRWFRG